MNRATHTDLTLPGKAEIRAASHAQRELAAHLATNLDIQRIQISDAQNQAHQIELPTSALRLLVEILSELAEGNAVRVLPLHAELTTQEAAELLNVSRPHLVKLLETGDLRYHKAGKHRRVRLDELMKYKTQRDAVSERAMEELSKQAHELQLGRE